MAYSGGVGPEISPAVAPVAGTKILLRRSGVQGKLLPTAGDAEYGELFINYHSGDPMLCFKDNSDNIVEIKPPRAIDGGGGEVPPDTGNQIGDLVWDGTHLRVWDGTAWQAVGPGSLAYVQKADGGTITNTAGDGCDIPLVNNLQAGLMAPGDKNKLDGYPATPGEISGTLDLQAVTDIGNTTTNGATFGGVVRAGGDPNNGNELGTELKVGGRVLACSSGANNVFQGYDQGNNTPTVGIFANGSASFAAGNIALNADGSASLADGNLTISDNGRLECFDQNRVTSTQGYLARGTGVWPSSFAFRGYSDGVEKIVMGSGGNAWFADNVVIGGGTAFTDPNITLSANGTSDFTGNMVVGDDPNTQANSGNFFGASGRNISRVDSDIACYTLYRTTDSVPRIQFLGDGGASFGAGNITLNANGRFVSNVADADTTVDGVTFQNVANFGGDGTYLQFTGKNSPNVSLIGVSNNGGTLGIFSNISGQKTSTVMFPNAGGLQVGNDLTNNPANITLNANGSGVFGTNPGSANSNLTGVYVFGAEGRTALYKTDVETNPFFVASKYDADSSQRYKFIIHNDGQVVINSASNSVGADRQH